MVSDALFCCDSVLVASVVGTMIYAVVTIAVAVFFPFVATDAAAVVPVIRIAVVVAVCTGMAAVAIAVVTAVCTAVILVMVATVITTHVSAVVTSVKGVISIVYKLLDWKKPIPDPSGWRGPLMYRVGRDTSSLGY
ncbi:hypothetical protein NDU88_002289 [Pleurodeles waltl]|uniref:Transmembrane protein n=1 Tax=Pleurodeles waltl TaxID=8319 RepID=A0AAV7TMP5_PLEWA|nr:hypothetical protein NDU88_002289 [Pleurodeles waltl]